MHRTVLLVSALAVVSGVAGYIGFGREGDSGLARAPASRPEVAPDAASSRSNDEAAATWARDQPLEGEGWRVISLFFAHFVQIVKVEVADPGLIPTISDVLVAPVRDRYVEMLIYFYHPHDHDYAFERVQWTPQGGFVRTVLDTR